MSAQSMRPPLENVTVHVASLNTRSALELCLRSMRLHAAHPFHLVVGDSGSTDGSVQMLEEFAADGWLTLQSHPGRMHAEWLDAWRAEAASRYLIFVDSDMDFRRGDWLGDLMAFTQSTQAAVAALDVKPLATDVCEPVSGRLVRVMPAPTTWLFVIDAPQLASVGVGFGFRSHETTAVPEGCVVYDTGAALLEEVLRQGLAVAVMPRSVRRSVKHYGSMTWMPAGGEGGRRKLRNISVIDRRLFVIRMLQCRSGMVHSVLAKALLRVQPPLEEALELLAKVRWRTGRYLSGRGRAPVRDARDTASR